MMKESNLRNRIIRLATQKPELRPVLLPLLRTKQAKLEVHMKAMDIVNDGFREMAKKLRKLAQDAAKALKKDDFELDSRQSYLEASDWGSDGYGVDGELVFIDRAALFRSEREVREIFSKAIDAWPTRVYGKDGVWQVYFGK